MTLKHTGMAQNTVSWIFLFSETQSAVVAASNGRRYGDASDFAAQILMQELFDLQPQVDILARAKLEAERAQKFRHDTVMLDRLKNRDVARPEKEAEEFMGKYAGFATTLNIGCDAATKKLTLVFNDRTDKPILLEYYSVDMYSFLPTTTERHFAGAWIDFDF